MPPASRDSEEDSGSDTLGPPEGGDRLRLILAWGVHLFTAAGALLGAGALLAIGREQWSACLLLMLAALFIDAVDGMLARAADVSERIPGIDGRRLDDMVDYLNYVIVPVVFLVATGALAHWSWGALPILASAYGFSQAEAKTADGFFLGFPSYWNVLAIYVHLLGISPAACGALVVLFSALVFVPLKYVYPSQLRVWRGTTFSLASFCFAAVGWAVIDPEVGRRLHLVELSLIFPAWYLGLSWRIGGVRRSAH